MSGKDDKVKETPEQRELAKIAAEKWNFSQETLAPLMQKYMDKTDSMKSDHALGYQAGRANEEAQAIQGEQRQQVNEQARQAGLDPSSGRAQMTNAQLQAGQAESAGDYSARSQNEQLNQHVMGLQNITAIGQGQASQAQAGIGQLAQISAQEQRADSQNKFNRRSANMQLVGSLAGAGAGYAKEQGMFGGASQEQQVTMNGLKDFQWGIGK